MKRSEFHHLFGSDTPIILPVIHVLTYDQVAANLAKIIKVGIRGCFLINHDFDIDTFMPMVRSIRKAYPDFWIGVNFLAVTGQHAFPILAKLEKEGCRIDAYWADDARIDERKDHQTEAEAILDVRQASDWRGLYFGGTAFKKQRSVDAKNYATAAKIAGGYMDVVTTSGVATGNAAEVSKIATFRHVLPRTPIALASGVTPDNASDYAMVDCFMVATGINIANDFYNIDPAKLRLLIAKCAKMGGHYDHTRD